MILIRNQLRKVPFNGKHIQTKVQHAVNMSKTTNRQSVLLADVDTYGCLLIFSTDENFIYLAGADTIYCDGITERVFLEKRWTLILPGIRSQVLVESELPIYL